MRFSKVRITRPGAPAMTGLDHLTADQAKEQAQHDKAVATYEEETLLAAAADLGARKVHDRRDLEHRWVMARRAAVLRLLDQKGAFR